MSPQIIDQSNKQLQMPNIKTFEVGTQPSEEKKQNQDIFDAFVKPSEETEVIPQMMICPKPLPDNPEDRIRAYKPEEMEFRFVNRMTNPFLSGFKTSNHKRSNSNLEIQMF